MVHAVVMSASNFVMVVMSSAANLKSRKQARNTMDSSSSVDNEAAHIAFPQPTLSDDERAARAHAALCFDFPVVADADAQSLASHWRRALECESADLLNVSAFPLRLRFLKNVTAGVRECATILCLDSALAIH